MKPKSTRATIVLCLIVFGSLAISGGLGAWLVRGLIAERGPGFQRPGAARGYYGATIWKGELWYIKHTPTKPGQVPQFHIHRRNLETGQDHRVNLALTDFPGELVATEDRLWMIGADVYESDGQSIQRTGPALPHPQTWPSGSPTLVCNYFVQYGVLSSVREFQPERYRLVHLIEGQWLDGLEVILPGLNRVWEDDEHRKRKVLAPRTCVIPSATFATLTTPALTVVPDGDRLHLIVLDLFMGFMAYRDGFEFPETALDSASALMPTNAPPEASGWEFVGEKVTLALQSATVLRGVPVIVASYQVQKNGVFEGTVFGRGWKRVARDRFEVIGDVHARFSSFLVVVSSPNHDDCYLLGQHSMQGAGVFAVEESGLRRLPHDLPGGEWPMIMWFIRFGIVLGIAWLTHLVVIVIGIGWFQTQQDRVIVSGHGAATVASVPRRAVARGIDLTLILLPLALHVGSLVHSADPVAVSHELWQQESRVTSIPRNNWQSNYFLIRINRRHLASAYATKQWSILGSLAVWFVFVAVEGAYGVTPGKWLCGLRTMRTTLRPCGFARAILRDVLLCIDVPLLLTPIPAVLSCAGTPHRQRLGDRMADTVVVEACSSRALSPNDAVVPQGACIPSGHE